MTAAAFTPPHPADELRLLSEGPDQSAGIVLSANKCQVHIAECLALARTMAHNGRRRPGEDLGSDAANLRADYAGILAELLVVEALEALDWEPHGYTFFAPSAPSGPDFSLYGRRFSIKAAPEGRPRVCVNEAQRLDERKRFDFLLPAQQLSRYLVRLYAPVPAASIACWQLDTVHSPFRWKSLRDLEPLRDWWELVSLPRVCAAKAGVTR